MLVHAHHDHRLVVLSVVISIVAAYAASSLAERIRGAGGRVWVAWLIGGAVVDGVGTWSMHYTGKLALRLPVPMQFDWRGVVLSLIVGIVGSFFALLIMSRGRMGWARAAGAAVVLGAIAISGLHYTAMAAMRLQGMRVQYRSPALMVLSVVLAIAVSFFALAAGAGVNRRLRYHGVAILRGLANPIMHFTAMAAVAFTASGEIRDLSHAVSISSVDVIGISVIPAMVLVVALLTIFADRLQTQRALLDQLFEQAPHAVALMNGDGRVVRINREFTRLFGFSAAEVLGRRLTEVMVPGDPGDRVETELLALIQGERLEAERVRRRKDGTDAHVSIVGVPVSVPGGEIETYAIYSDVTEQKNAREALRTFPQRLIETQEAERQRIARELHDEIGQVLTSAGMMLALSQRQPAAAQTEIAEARALLDDLIGRVRNLALDLRPSILDHFGLTAALSWFFEQVTAQTGVRVVFDDLLPEDARFGAEIETAAYRIIQEALTNIARHAAVREATVSVSTDGDLLVVEVEDLGTGFAQERVSAQSFGLTGMRERTNILGGRLIIETSPGAGTRVIAELPL